MTIYVDVYLLLNFFIDYLSLLSAEKICFLPESKTRCFIGAIIGASYSLAAFIFQLPSPVHIVTAVIMVLCITHRKSILKKVSAFFIFLSAEVFIGGCITALKSFSYRLPKKSLIFSAVIILFAVLGSMSYTLIYLIAKRRLSSVSLTATLWHNERSSNVILMIDSGNLVRESSTQKRVIFIKAESIKRSTGDPDTLFEREKCYVIPIDTTAGKGCVMGFIPDKIEFSDKRYNKEEFIVVPDTKGGKFGGYDGIAPMI